MDDELGQLLDDVLDDLSQAGEGMLLAVAAAYQPDTPEHLEAWADLDRVVDAAEAQAAVAEVRARVASWASMGAHVTGGHLGTGWAAASVHEARIRVGRALVDYLLAYLFREPLRAESFRTLVAPWGLPDDAAEAEADAADEAEADEADDAAEAEADEAEEGGEAEAEAEAGGAEAEAGEASDQAEAGEAEAEAGEASDQAEAGEA